MWLIIVSLLVGLVGGFFWLAKVQPKDHETMVREMRDGRYGSVLVGLLVAGLPIAALTCLLLLLIRELL